MGSVLSFLTLLAAGIVFLVFIGVVVSLGMRKDSERARRERGEPDFVPQDGPDLNP